MAPTLAAQRFTPSEPAPGVSGPGPASRIVAIHGFTQTSACWDPIDEDLARDHELVLVDAPGHGASTGVEADLWSGGDAIAAVAGGPATLLGYSMGGRFALHAALAHPEVVERLVLVSTTAGLDDPAERAARRAGDEALAQRVLDVGVEAFLDEWLAQPLFATLPAERAHRRARLANSPAGLASSLRLAGTGSQDSLWARLGEVRVPVLVVAGAIDAKYVALARRLRTGIGPRAELVVLPDAGHTVHLEQPAAFLAALREWLARTPRPLPT